MRGLKVRKFRHTSVFCSRAFGALENSSANLSSHNTVTNKRYIYRNKKHDLVEDLWIQRVQESDPSFGLISHFAGSAQIDHFGVNLSPSRRHREVAAGQMLLKATLLQAQ